MSLMGSSSFCQSAFNPSSPSSIHSAQLLLPYRKFARKKMASSVISMASLCNSVSVTDEIALSKRRVFILIGVSAIPFMHITEVAANEPAEEKADIGNDYQGSKLIESNISASGSRVMEMKIGLQIRSEAELEFALKGPREAEQDIEAQAPNLENPKISSQQPKQSKQEAEQTNCGNSFISFQKGIGVVGSVVLGVLFAASQRRKKALESTIDSDIFSFAKRRRAVVAQGAAMEEENTYTMFREFAISNMAGVQQSIQKPAVNANNFELKYAIIHMMQEEQFGGGLNEDPHAHLANFEEICDTVKLNGVSEDAIKLRFFPFSLKDRAKDSQSQKLIGTGRRQGGLYILDELRVPDIAASSADLSYFHLTSSYSSFYL